MNIRLLLMVIIFGAGNPALGVITGMSWYQYSQNHAQGSLAPDVVLLHDSHKDDLVPQEAAEQALEMEKLLDFLKEVAQQGRPVHFFTEGQELQREQLEAGRTFPMLPHAVVLHTPTRDSIQNGRQQSNFEYTWFDLRDEENDYPWCEKFKQDSEGLIGEHYIKARAILQEADYVRPDMKICIDKYMQDVVKLAKSPNHPLHGTGVLFALALDTDVNLACSVYKQACSQDKPLIVAYGGLAHMKPIELVLQVDRGNVIMHQKTVGKTKIGHDEENHVPPRLPTFYADIRAAFINE